MRIIFSRLIVLGALVGVALAAACGNSTTSTAATGTTSTGSTSTTSQAASPVTPSTPTTSAAGSPTPTSPASSSMSSPTPGAVTLAQAFANLSQQPSFVMKMTVTGMTGMGSAAAVLPNAGPSMVVTTERNGNDAHIVVSNPDGTRLAQVWRIGDRQWVDRGSGPQPADAGSPQLAALLPIISAPSLLLQTFSGSAGQYTVTGHETVNGVPTTVEKGTFQVSNAARSVLFPVASASVNSTIWVAQQGGYLVRANLQLSGTGGTPTTGTATAGGGTATVNADVTDVGSAPTIATPTP